MLKFSSRHKEMPILVCKKNVGLAQKVASKNDLGHNYSNNLYFLKQKIICGNF